MKQKIQERLTKEIWKTASQTTKDANGVKAEGAMISAVILGPSFINGCFRIPSPEGYVAEIGVNREDKAGA